MINKLTRLSAPISVNIEVIATCNSKCFFCFSSTEEYKDNIIGTDRINLKTRTQNIKKIMDILKDSGVMEIRWFGGEFSLLPNWRELVIYGYELGFLMSFVSNGTIFDESDIIFLSEHGVVSGGISIHGLGDIHDQIVQTQGSYEKAISNIKLFKIHGININVIFTPNEKNLYHFEEFARHMVDNVGVVHIGVNRLFHGDSYKNLMLKDYLYLFEIIHRLQSEGKKIFFVDSFPLCKIPMKYWKYTSRCSQGVGFAQVDYNGNIKNCPSLSVGIGNVFDECLKDIWNNKLAVFRELKHLPLSCRLCPIFCGGGCIASKTTKSNFIADEFILLPENENILKSLVLILSNYIKRFCLYFEKNDEILKPKEWCLHDIPVINGKYRIREEGYDCYLCMIDNKGVFQLNKQSFNIFSLINGKNSVQDIIDKSIDHGYKLYPDDVYEVLDLIC